MVTTRRQHSGGAVQTSISPGVGSGDLSMTLAASTGWPDGSVGPFFAVIDRGLTSEEKILITSRSSNVLTLPAGGRGQDGTAPTAHVSGAVIFPVWTAIEADEANAHSSTGAGVHGVAAVVGTTDAQTLTNKTIDFGSNTITGEPATFSFYLDGVVTVGVSNIEILIPRAMSLTGLYARVASGSGVTVQLMKDGIAVGPAEAGVFTTTIGPTFAAVAFAAGSRLGLQVTNAGTSATNLAVSTQSTFTA